MTPLHPASAGSPIAVWFIGDEPVRLVSGGARFRVVGAPKCGDINGVRYWRLRAVGDDGRMGTFDIAENDEGWVLAGIDQDAARTGAS